MDLLLLGLWGVASGLAYGAIARRVERARRVRDRAQDFYAIAWYGLAATSFLFAAYAGALWGGQDVALVATVRLGLILSFVLAIAALLTAGWHYAVAERAARRKKAEANAKPASPRPQG